MGNIVGIDLGTTNSVAAFKFSDTEVVTAPDNPPPDRKLTRSVVSLDGDRLIVGENAYNQLKQSPENVIMSIKRLMGRGFGDEVVQKQLGRFGYKISKPSQGTENAISVWLNGKEYQPEDISAEIIKKVVQNAQIYQQQRGQQQKITQAVVTIPAYFNDKQRYATQMAAQRAGLGQPELLPEPTAAAISYGYSPNSDDVKTILVYDFGGGTFDSSLITASGNQFIESSKAGDLWLGGDDIDDKIIEFVKQKVAQAEDLDNIDELIESMPYYQKVRFKADLKMEAEKAKIQLSKANTAKILPSTPLLDELGMAITVDIEITRQDFEKLILPLVERSIAICQDAIKYSDYPEDMIDVVLLVGGSSQIPLVQQKVRAAFGDKVVVHPRPMYAVAEGAAIVAAGLTEKVGTVSRDYFIELVDNPRFPLINQGDILPVIKSHTFKTEADGQELIHFKFFSPDQVRESIDLRKNDERLGDMWLALDQAYPKGTEVLVTAELDEKNSSLQITANLKNDPSIKVSASFSRGNSDELISNKVEQRIAKLNREGDLTQIGVKRAYQIAGDVVRAANQIRNQDGNIQEDRLRVAQEKLRELEIFANDDHEIAKYFINEFEFAIEYGSIFIDDVQEQRILSLIQELQTALSSNNISALQKLAENCKQEYENLPYFVRIILLCRAGVKRANQIAPTHGNLIAAKFLNFLNAIKYGDGAKADQLLRELLPEIEPYLDQKLPTGTIATGLTR
jgi:molecular chaperone DnaK